MRLLIFSTQLQANCYNHIYHIKEPARNDLGLVLCWCARWAHVLKGESPQSVRQWEGYSLSQGCLSWGRIWRKMAAKLWPDEQKPYIRPQPRVRLPRKSKSNNCTESSVVNMAGKEGKNVWVPGEISQAHEVDVIRKKCVVTTNCEKSAEAIVPEKNREGPNNR